MAAPSEASALEALKFVQNLSGKEIEARITAEVGNPMLGVFNALAQALFPGAPKEELPRLVHLMVLGYLLRNQV